MDEVPPSLMHDLRAGMSVEEGLKKHETSLQEIFQKNYNRRKRRTDPKYVLRQETNHFTINKKVNNVTVHFGTFETIDDAVKVRDELMKCDWDKTRIPEICKQVGVIPCMNVRRGKKKKK